MNKSIRRLLLGLPCLTAAARAARIPVQLLSAQSSLRKSQKLATVDF